MGALGVHDGAAEEHGLIGGVVVGALQHQREHFRIGQQPVGEIQDVLPLPVGGPGNPVVLDVFALQGGVFPVNVEHHRVAGGQRLHLLQQLGHGVGLPRAGAPDNDRVALKELVAVQIGPGPGVQGVAAQAQGVFGPRAAAREDGHESGQLLMGHAAAHGVDGGRRLQSALEYRGAPPLPGYQGTHQGDLDDIGGGGVLIPGPAGDLSEPAHDFAHHANEQLPWGRRLYDHHVVDLEHRELVRLGYLYHGGSGVYALHDTDGFSLVKGDGLHGGPLLFVSCMCGNCPQYCGAIILFQAEKCNRNTLTVRGGVVGQSQQIVHACMV